jgi:hypothetical protein
MCREFDPRERAAEAARLLSYFLLDLIVGTRGLEIFEAPVIAPKVTHHMAVALNRMAVSHLVVTLAKWTEFYRRYASILPVDVRDACRELNASIEARGVIDFRTAVVGHILDDATKRPLTSREVDERLNRIMAGERADFFRWINDVSGNVHPGSVVAFTERVRDRLRVEYELRDEEIL